MASPTGTDTRPSGSTGTYRLPLAAGLDVASVVLFVAIGRRSHDEDPGLAGVFATAAPFLVGLAVAWLLGRAWRRPDALATGLVVWSLTVAVGMLLRRFVFDEGTAASFVIVATIFLGTALVGWRAVLAVADRRRASSDAGDAPITA